MWDISVWLDDVDDHQAPSIPSSVLRKQDADTTVITALIRSPKRRRLRSLDGNAGSGIMATPKIPKHGTSSTTRAMDNEQDQTDVRRSLRSATSRAKPSAAKRSTVKRTADRRNVYRQPLAARPEDQDEEEAEQEQDSAETPRPPIQRLERLMDRDLRFTPHFPPAEQQDRASSASKTSTRTSRSRSPVKDAVDLQMADIPVLQRTRAEVILPKSVEDLCGRLEDIAAGVGILPRSIKAEMQRLDNTLTIRNWYLGDDDSDGDGRAEVHELELEEMVRIRDDARKMERDNQSEAAWNSEVHSRILRLALSPRHHRIAHFNVTQAYPSTAFLPTRASKIAQGRLVDYTINIMPTSNEEKAIEDLISTQSEKQATITQTMYTALRTRPCAISIETKSDSGSSAKAKNQLAVWSAAHMARLRSLFDIGDDVPEGDEHILAVHPVIYVQQHDWNMYLVVSRQDGKVIHEIDLHTRIGSSTSLFEIWKLSTSLRLLSQWAEKDYWPALREKIETSLQ